MDDSKDTIVVTGIGEKADGEDFIKHFASVGEIKTGKLTGQRMALMRFVKEKMCREGIVTYSDASKAQQAVGKFNEKDFKGSVISVELAEEHYKPMLANEGKKNLGRREADENTAWQCWREEARRRILGGGERVGGRGGKGGEGGGSRAGGWFAWLGGRGQDGEPGEDGLDGKGGKGGKGGKSWFG